METQSNKRIFKYFNGKKEVFADPLAVERRFLRNCDSVDISSILKRYYGPDWIRDIRKTDENGISYNEFGEEIPEATPENIEMALRFKDEAIEELLPVLYKTFGLSPVDPETGEGTTEIEILNAFDAYNVFQYELKKSTEKTQNSEQSSATDQTEETTNNGLGSTTIESEPLQSERLA